MSNSSWEFEGALFVFVGMYFHIPRGLNVNWWRSARTLTFAVWAIRRSSPRSTVATSSVECDGRKIRWEWNYLREFRHGDMLCRNMNFRARHGIFWSFRETKWCDAETDRTSTCDSWHGVNVDFTGAERQQSDHCTTSSNRSISKKRELHDKISFWARTWQWQQESILVSALMAL